MTQADSDENDLSQSYLPFYEMFVYEQTLNTAAANMKWAIDIVLPAAKRTLAKEYIYDSRASLLMFDGDEWYVAAVTAYYDAVETTLRLRKGQGFAGEAWERMIKEWDFAYPHQTPPEKMLADWSQFKDDPGLIERTRFMRTIISIPLYLGNSMVGILSLDSVHILEGDIKTQFVEKLQPLMDEVVEQLRRSLHYYFLPHPKYRALRNILNAARLLPPIEVPTRSGVYWVDEARNELYLIVGSELDPTIWSTGTGLRYRKGQYVVGKAWEKGGTEFYNDEGLEEIETRKKLGLSGKRNEAIWKTIQPTKSAVAVPLWDNQKIVGVFSIECDANESTTQLRSEHILILSLARLIEKVLFSEL